MKIKLPILEQSIENGNLISAERDAVFNLDTSVYSEERWEQHFPTLASKEGLFQYVERIQKDSVTERVKVACMLKAIYCFIESDEIPTYKSFAQMINLATPEYTTRMIKILHDAFNIILNSSSVKN